MPVREVVEQAGFHDHPFFTKRFKREYEVTPLQYRRRRKAEKGGSQARHERLVAVGKDERRLSRKKRSMKREGEA
jgi:AraC-like DNA-binding protein